MSLCFEVKRKEGNLRRGWDVARLIEYKPCICEALGLTPQNREMNSNPLGLGVLLSWQNACQAFTETWAQYKHRINWAWKHTPVTPTSEGWEQKNSDDIVNLKPA